ncbi:putative polyprenol reductase-like protein, partial [Dinothrombium tinctorium]
MGFVYYFLVGISILMEAPGFESAGSEVNTGYSMPSGGWFECISCPHYFAEIVIYFSLCLIFGGRNTSWWM